ncbi:MAG: AAA family ATPase [Candidatus Hodarchaeales archaeon]
MKSEDKIRHVSLRKKGFDLQELILKRFMSYEKEIKLKFDSPTMVITGPTGSGKTSILDGITFALYARTTRLDTPKAKIKDICREGGHVCLKFSIGGKTVEIKRGILKKGAKSFLELFVNGQRINGKIVELNRKIVQLVGLGYEAFASASFIRQDEMKLLGSKTDSERLTTLQKLFRLDIFDNISDKLKEERKKKEMEKRGILGKIEILRKNLSEIDEKRRKKERLKHDIGLLSSKITSIKKKIKDTEVKVRELDTFRIEYSEVKNRIKRSHMERNDKIHQIKKIKKEQQWREGLKRDLKHLEERTKDTDNITAEISNLKEKKIKYNQIKNLYNSKRKELERTKYRYNKMEKEIENDLKSLKSRIESLSTRIDHEEAFKQLKREGKLTERIERIKLEENWLKDRTDIIKRLQEEKKDAKHELTIVKETTSSINRDSFILSDLKENLSKIRQKREELSHQKENEIGTVNKELENTNNALKGVEFNQKMESKLKVLEEKLSQLNAVKRELKVIKRNLENVPDRGTLLDSLKSEIKALLSSAREDQSREEELREKVEELQEVEEKLFELKDNHLKLEKQLSAENQDLKNINLAIEKLERDKTEIETLTVELNRLEKDIKIDSILIDEVFHHKGIPFFAVNKLLPRIGKKASLILSSLTDDRYNNVVLEKTTGTKRTGFDILIDTPAGYRDIATFSGGEKTQINAAIRLAVSEELSQLGDQTITGFNTLFIDEGDLGSLDTAKSQQLFVKRLFSLTDKFSKIILITHLDEISEKFDSCMRLTIDSNGFNTLL